MLHRVLAIRTVVSRNMDQAVGMDFPLARIVAIFLLLCKLLANWRSAWFGGDYPRHAPIFPALLDNC